MEKYTDFCINVLLTNGDVFAKTYATMAEAEAVFAKMKGNPLVVYASLHDEYDVELAIIDHS